MKTLTRKNRQTGTTIHIEPSDNGPFWTTICDEHGFCCDHGTKRLAIEWAAEPAVWCEGCAQMNAKVKTGKGLRCDVCGAKAAMSQPGKKIRRCWKHIPKEVSA